MSFLILDTLLKPYNVESYTGNLTKDSLRSETTTDLVSLFHKEIAVYIFIRTKEPSFYRHKDLLQQKFEDYGPIWHRFP